MDALNTIGLLALAVGIILSTLSIRDYFVRLRMFPTWIEVVDTGNNTALVLFRLSFVNRSSKGKVVRTVEIKHGIEIRNKLVGVVIAEANQKIDLALQTVTYSIPNVSRQLPFSEALLPCLDIAPYQSQSRWMAFAVAYDKDHLVDKICFRAVGTHKKPNELVQVSHQLLLGSSYSVPIDNYLHGIAGKSFFADD